MGCGVQWSRRGFQPDLCSRTDEDATTMVSRTRPRRDGRELGLSGRGASSVPIQEYLFFARDCVRVHE